MARAKDLIIGIVTSLWLEDVLKTIFQTLPSCLSNKWLYVYILKWPYFARWGKGYTLAKWPIRLELISVSVTWSDFEYNYFYSSLDGMLLHRRATPSIKFTAIHLYTRVETGTVRVKCLVQEHNTMSPTIAESSARTMKPQRLYNLTESYLNVLSLSRMLITFLREN